MEAANFRSTIQTFLEDFKAAEDRWQRTSQEAHTLQGTAEDINRYKTLVSQQKSILINCVSLLTRSLEQIEQSPAEDADTNSFYSQFQQISSSLNQTNQEMASLRGRLQPLPLPTNPSDTKS